MEIKNENPLIAAFLCNWCSYAGADLAGVMRCQYPPNVRIIKVMCSGRIDPHMVFDTFLKGADGVMVAGCHIGDCHYLSGNVHAKQKMNYVMKVIEFAKIPKERFRLEWISAGEGKIFAEVITSFTKDLKALVPVKDEVINGLPTIQKMEAARDEFLQFQTRWMEGKDELLSKNKNVYDEQLDENKINAITGEIIIGNYVKNIILRLLRDKTLSVKQISEMLNMKKNEVFQYIVQMKSEGLVDFKGEGVGVIS